WAASSSFVQPRAASVRSDKEVLLLVRQRGPRLSGPARERSRSGCRRAGEVCGNRLSSQTPPFARRELGEGTGLEGLRQTRSASEYAGLNGRFSRSTVVSYGCMLSLEDGAESRDDREAAQATAQDRADGCRRRGGGRGLVGGRRVRGREFLHRRRASGCRRREHEPRGWRG